MFGVGPGGETCAMDVMQPLGHGACEAEVPPAPAIGVDERRMHVRAYNFWVSLLRGRLFPSVEDLRPEAAADFAPHAVLLDFRDGTANPAIPHLGDALRAECAAAGPIARIADVPGGSLLSRLTDHYHQILANRAPIGFEAEFVNRRGHPTLYRGILMPFATDGSTIDFVYGVINWKEQTPAPRSAPVERAAVAPVPPRVDLERAPISTPERPTPERPISEPPTPEPPAPMGLAAHLEAARAEALRAQGARLKSHAALYRALGLAYDFALLAAARPDDYAALLRAAQIRPQARAPMSAIVRLVFGAGVDKARATEFAAALAQAKRLALPAGTFADHVSAQPGGIKALVAAERRARRPVDAGPAAAEIARAALRKVAPLMRVEIPSDPAEFVLLLARREPDGALALVAPVPDESALVDRAIRKITK